MNYTFRHNLKAKNICLMGVFSLLCLSVLSSCSLNLPTAKKDAEHAIDSATSKVTDIFRKTFDPQKNDLISPDEGLSRKDIRDTLITKKGPIIQDIPPSPVLPDVSSLLIEPRVPLLGRDKLVSISVTQDVPLRDVILELARRAEVDVEIDPGISGGIIFRAKDKPFSVVIERIADLGGLRCSVTDGILKVERDTAFIVNYMVPVLNMIRSNSSSVSLSTQVLSAGVGEGGGDSFNTGSNSELTTSYEGDVWQEIETTLNNIIGSFSGEVSTFAAGEGDAYTDDVLSGAPAVEGDAAGGSAGPDQSSVIAINRHTGMVTILATERQHREVKQYLDYSMQLNSSQVLIEAKILEVNLTDEYRSGIDWTDISYGNNTGNVASGALTNSLSGITDSIFSFGVVGRPNILGNDLDFNATVQLVEQFGVVKTLSNPRINALNNQQAVLTFAENEVFFDLDVQNDESGVGSTSESSVTVDSTIRTVPIGVILTLQPSIDVVKNEVTMNIRPTLSRVTSTVSDPGTAIALATVNDDLTEDIAVTSSVPVVEVREIDTTLRVKSGQVMVIGGLIEERNTNEDKGVPGLSEVPYVGNLFKSVKKTKSVVETIIFIKATIVPGFGVETMDKDFYKKFSTDRRPIAF